VQAVAALPGVTLAIAGAGPERARLVEQAAALGVADRVRFLGAVPHGDLPSIIAAADVMALASASEGLANAWIEALACGTPIVISDAGGAREVVTSPAAGRIVPAAAGEIATAIMALLENPPAPQAVRAHAERFTWAANTAALVDHLGGLVAGRQRSGMGPPQASSG
jgi:teichuronic acid biosynthesis glycosyltransferase TuaC